MWSVSQAMISKQWNEQSDVTINLKTDGSYTMLSLNSLYMEFVEMYVLTQTQAALL